MKVKLLRATVFIDGANMYFAQKKLGWQISWQKAKKYLDLHYTVSEIRYYSGLKDGDTKMKQFLTKLSDQSIAVVKKPLKKIFVGRDKGGSGFIFKANFDVEITTDLLTQIDRYQYAILFSGDSDFEYVIKYCQKLGKKVIVCGIEKSMSHELKQCADEVIWLGNIRSEIEYKKPRSENRGSLNTNNVSRGLSDVKTTENKKPRPKGRGSVNTNTLSQKLKAAKNPIRKETV